MSISNGDVAVGSSSILAPLNAFLSSGTCFTNRLRTFVLRMFGIGPYLQAGLITLANLIESEIGRGSQITRLSELEGATVPVNEILKLKAIPGMNHQGISSRVRILVATYFARGAGRQ